MKQKSDITILVDMDDTLVDLLGSWIRFLNEKYGTTVTVDMISEWSIPLFFPQLTPEQVYEPLYLDEFWETVFPLEDAVYYLRKLKDEGYKIRICTASHYKTLNSKMKWALFRNFDFLTWDDVIVIKEKKLIKADFLIDDGVHNLIDGEYQGILMDAPHNRRFDAEKHNILRVFKWKEVYEVINRLSKGG